MDSTEVAKKEETTLGAEQLKGMLATMTVNTAVNLAAGMLSLEPGQKERVVFTGMTKVSKFNSENGELVDAVELFTKDGIMKSADKVLVSSLRDKPKNFPCLVVCTGWEKGKNGEYRKFDIFPLEVADENNKKK